MENKKIIIILLVIILILAAALGVLFLNQANAKEPTELKITSDKEQEGGGELSIILTTLNNTPISKEVVNITVTNSKGQAVFDGVVKTNSNGKAKTDFDLKKGNYNVTVSYGGSENYTGNNTMQKLTIKEEIVEEEPVQQSTQSSRSSGNPYDINNLPSSNDPYPETSREQLDENTVMQKYEDGYISYVDLRTGKRTSGGYYK